MAADVAVDGGLDWQGSFVAPGARRNVPAWGACSLSSLMVNSTGPRDIDHGEGFFVAQETEVQAALG